MNAVVPEERPFFEERQDEGIHLSRKAMQKYEDDREQLEQEQKRLVEKEEIVRSAHRAFLKNEKEENLSGT